MNIGPLSTALGAQVTEFDCARIPSVDEEQGLLAAYAEHHLLLFRDQDLTVEQQERLVSLFGPLIDEMGDGQVSGLLSNLSEAAGGTCPLPFHSDFSFTATPAQGIALFALELPSGGTSTFFANGVRGAATLPPELLIETAGRVATHALAYFVTGDEGARSRDVALGAPVPRHEHPVLRTHPRTGQPVLYVTDLHTERINELDEEHSRRLLEALLDHLYGPDNVYEHRWRLGDLVIWDNQALQHRRPDVTQAKPRVFRRNTLNTAGWIEMVGPYM